MKRILIIGSCGSGKTTFAKALKTRTDIDVIHLDKLYYGPDWRRPPHDAWRDMVAREIARDEWIIDGNYNSTLDLRIQRADTIFYFHVGTFRCLYNVTKRILTQMWSSSKRDDIPCDCSDRFALSLYRKILTFNWLHDREYSRKLKELREIKEVHIFHSYSDARSFLASVRGGKNPPSMKGAYL